MAREQEKVFIIDEKTQNAMRLNPEYADAKNALEEVDFKVICLDDTQNKELFSGDKAEPIGDFQGMTIKSDLYLTDKSYFPLRYYSQSYFVQLNILMKKIASYMGARKWEFSYIEEVFDSKKYDRNSNSSGEGKYTDMQSGISVGAGFGYANTAQSIYNNEAKFDYQYSEELVGRKKSPQELANFIKEQEININAFDPSFKRQIQDYIRGEQIGTTSQIVDKSERINEYNKTIRNISGNANIMDFFKANFKIDLKDELTTEHRQRIKLLYKMTFK